MIATAITLAIVWFVAAMLGQLLRQNGNKILAALHGRSESVRFEAAGPRVSPIYRAEATVRHPALRAAA